MLWPSTGQSSEIERVCAAATYVADEGDGTTSSKGRPLSVRTSPLQTPAATRALRLPSHSPVSASPGGLLPRAGVALADVPALLEEIARRLPPPSVAVVSAASVCGALPAPSNSSSAASMSPLPSPSTTSTRGTGLPDHSAAFASGPPSAASTAPRPSTPATGPSPPAANASQGGDAGGRPYGIEWESTWATDPVSAIARLEAAHFARAIAAVRTAIDVCALT